VLGFNVIAADTDEAALFQASSWQQAVVNLRSGRPSRLPTPVERYAERIGLDEQALLAQISSCSAIGAAPKVTQALEEFINRTGANELMISSMIFEHAARLRYYEITANIQRTLLQPAS